MKNMIWSKLKRILYLYRHWVHSVARCFHSLFARSSVYCTERSNNRGKWEISLLVKTEKWYLFPSCHKIRQLGLQIKDISFQIYPKADILSSADLELTEAQHDTAQNVAWARNLRFDDELSVSFWFTNSIQ